MKHKIYALLLGLAVWGSFAADLYAGASPAQQVIEDFLSTIRAMECPVKNQAQHDALTQKANAALDLESMGDRALGDHLKEATADQHKAFLELLWKLIEYVAYPKSSRFLGHYQITYPEIKNGADGVEVHSVVKQEEQALDAKVIYHVSQKDGVWKVNDIILDDVSIIEDLHFQFDSIVKESQFPGLLQKMKERLNQAVKENGLTAAP